MYLVDGCFDRVPSRLRRGKNVAHRLSDRGAWNSGSRRYELLMGCRNQPELDQTRKFLTSFNVVWPDSSEFERACQLLVSLRLSSGLGIPDCLIAAMALSRG